MRRFLIVLTLALIVLVALALGVTIAQWPRLQHLLTQPGAIR